MRHRLMEWILMVCVTGAAFGVHDASAYVRTRTCDRTGAFTDTKICRPDQEPREVYWSNRCITYYINRKGSEQLGGLTDELLATIEASFAAWEDVDCSNISFALGGLTCNTNVGREDEDITGGNQNLVLWEESNWTESTDAIAITVVSPDPNTGEILDADIVMNGQHFRFDILSNPNDTVADVQNTLTHEVGHLIGFNHETDEPAATMFPNAVPGELDKRDLHPDDIAGLCAVYPGTLPGVCTPNYINDRTCTLEYGGELGCTTATPTAAITPSSPTSQVLWLALLSIFGLSIGVGRRQRRRAST